MTPNLVQIIAPMFGGQLMARLAPALGIAPETARRLAQAAVPAVLAALARLAGTAEGARRIAEQIQNQDSNLLGAMVDAIGRPGQESFIATGNGMLAALFGAEAEALAPALARHTGATTAQAGAMLGVVTPAIFGALAQQDPQIWSSGEGIAALFARERGAIEAAAPPPEAVDAPPPAAPGEPSTPASAARAGGLPRWIKFAAAAAGLALLAWMFWPKPVATTTGALAPATPAALAPPAGAILPARMS